jgi:hypothetical protein
MCGELDDRLALVAIKQSIEFGRDIRQRPADRAFRRPF